MKRIEVPSLENRASAYRQKYAIQPSQSDAVSLAFKHAYIEAIAYANEEMGKSESALLDALKEISEYAIDGMSSYKWNEIYRIASEAVKQSKQPEPWTPKPGDKCAFWRSSQKSVKIGTFTRKFDEEYRYTQQDESPYDWDPAYHCALIESIDEIGKPPNYFIERGRCTIEKK